MTNIQRPSLEDSFVSETSGTVAVNTKNFSHSYDSCDCQQCPIWSNPSIINQTFTILYHAKVPKTGSAEWANRIKKIAKNEAIKPQIVWKMVPQFQRTFKAPNIPQRFSAAIVPIQAIRKWIQSFSAQIIKTVIKFDTRNSSDINYNIDIAVETVMAKVSIVLEAHMPFVDNFTMINNLWRKNLHSFCLSKHYSCNWKYNNDTVDLFSISSLSRSRCDSCVMHMHIYVNNAIRVSWIIYLRDPISHQISRFYFWREKNKKLYQKGQYTDINDMSFDECVAAIQTTSTGDGVHVVKNPCYLSINYFTRWLCGLNQHDCGFELLTLKRSLNRAINNLNKYFDFVGIVEYYTESWNFLMLKYPRLSYVNIDTTRKHNSAKKRHNQPSSETMKRLTALLSLDIDLHTYAKTRFEHCILPAV